jgi:hypothetical protein
MKKVIVFAAIVLATLSFANEAAPAADANTTEAAK